MTQNRYLDETYFEGDIFALTAAILQWRALDQTLIKKSTKKILVLQVEICNYCNYQSLNFLFSLNCFKLTGYSRANENGGLIKVISIGLGTAGESHESYWMPNALSTFVSWHVLEYFFIFP